MNLNHRAAGRFALSTLALFAISMTAGGVAVRPAPAAAGYMSFGRASSGCTQAGAAGDWGYTYNGTIIPPSGAPVPVAAVGRFTQDTTGRAVGRQTRSVAGATAEENVRARVTVHSDCTATMVARIFVGGQLQRTAYLSLVYTNGQNALRLIFDKLVQADGTQLPVVVTLDATRL